MTVTFSGVAAAPGVGIGVTSTFLSASLAVNLPAETVLQDPNHEWRRVQDALAAVDGELEALAHDAGTLIADLLASHRLIVQDETLLGAIRNAIYDGGLSAPTAAYSVFAEVAETIRNFDDVYFAGRSSDLVDIGQRLLSHLGVASGRPKLDALTTDTILLGDDLTVGAVAQLRPEAIQGIALAEGAPTAHAAILARSLGIPLVCGLGTAVLPVQPGQKAIVDGNRGILLLEPDSTTLRHYDVERHSRIEELALAARSAHAPAATSDGLVILVLANANSPEDVDSASDVGADGIGLLRTEYLFQERSEAPSLEEQVETYSAFIHRIHPAQLTVRALDAGGDKPLAFLPHPAESNPFLGLRGVRLLINEPTILRTQYRALQIAMQDHGGAASARFMLPMIATVEELLTVRSLLDDLNHDLPAIPLGVMIEVPSAALLAHELAQYADFFSIGTNDLAQYTLATDRAHRIVGALADPLHPAVLRLISMTCRAAEPRCIPVSLCGEIAGDPTATPLLVGLGVRELSAPLRAVALVKAAVRRHSSADCVVLAERSIGSVDAESVRRLLASSWT